jgi:hypothetical protein
MATIARWKTLHTYTYFSFFDEAWGVYRTPSRLLRGRTAHHELRGFVVRSFAFVAKICLALGNGRIRSCDCFFIHLLCDGLIMLLIMRKAHVQDLDRRSQPLPKNYPRKLQPTKARKQNVVHNHTHCCCDLAHTTLLQLSCMHKLLAHGSRRHWHRENSMKPLPSQVLLPPIAP